MAVLTTGLESCSNRNQRELGRRPRKEDAGMGQEEGDDPCPSEEGLSTWRKKWRSIGQGEITFFPERIRRADEGCQPTKSVGQKHQGTGWKAWAKQRVTGWGSRSKE